MRRGWGSRAGRAARLRAAKWLLPRIRFQIVLCNSPVMWANYLAVLPVCSKKEVTWLLEFTGWL